MARQHYHVIAGMGGGYLPYGYGDDTPTYTNRREAESYAHELVSERRHDFDMPEVWYGSARNGYVRKSRDKFDLGEYIEVVSCAEPECLEERENW